MTLKEQIDVLRQQGYSEVLAQAKVVHDIVLLAIARSGFKTSGTLKGGVVMSALTKAVRPSPCECQGELAASGSIGRLERHHASRQPIVILTFRQNRDLA